MGKWKPDPRFSPLLLAMLSLSRLCGSLAFATCAALSLARADVEVRTNDGRTLAGVIDSRTTDKELWIRQESDEIVLATPVGWDSIESASVDGQPVEVAQLIADRTELATASPTGFLLTYTEPLPTYEFIETVPARCQVTSLEMDAMLVNLDRDVEPDGYEIVIAAVDESGQNVPVRGDLYVRLFVERILPNTGRRAFQDVQQWTLPVAEHDFDEHGVAAYVLPWRNLEPEFDFSLCTAANLNARLGVVGDGDYAATVSVPVRDFNPYRDQLQIYEGSRFFPNELSRYPRPRFESVPRMIRTGWAD